MVIPNIAIQLKKCDIFVCKFPLKSRSVVCAHLPRVLRSFNRCHLLRTTLQVVQQYCVVPDYVTLVVV